jgi:colicin import membrane protein
MKATSFKVNSGVKEDRWVWMMALSFCFHLTILSTTLFIPQTAIPFPSIEERIYHVELVGTPSGVRSGTKARGVAKRKETSHIFDAKTRRIAIKKKKTALIVAKRVSPIAPERNNFYSPSELIDSAISKIERRVKEEKPTQPEKILDKFKGDTEDLYKGKKGGISGISKGEKGGISGISSYTGATIQLYQMEIESTIKNNWSYPVALLNLKRGEKIPEAVIIVTVRSDGKILKARFKRRSKNILFDDSVLKAIERSDPLPEFPPGYWKSYEEIEINFSLKDLVQY